ncbi:MAG: helix-turn-helix transcriptional regulator [Actinobacteria bacterium]|nr:helix-turn-helix transcriptional regulator [Actinomycetota bacterium]
MEVSPEEDLVRAKRLLGERIRRRRKKVGLNQENLALLAQVDRSHMSTIETGKAWPGVWTLIRIAGVLGTTPARLLRGLKWTPADRVSDYIKKPEK